MLTIALAVIRSALGAAVMLVGWFLVFCGQAAAMIGLAIVGLMAIGTLDLPPDVAGRATGFVWQGAASLLVGVLMVYVVGPLIGARPSRARLGRESRFTA